MLDYYYQKEADESCFVQDTESPICPVELDVSYIKKSKDPKHKLVYALTEDDLAYFNDDDLESGELKRFIQNISIFTLNYEIKVDYS